MRTAFETYNNSIT